MGVTFNPTDTLAGQLEAAKSQELRTERNVQVSEENQTALEQRQNVNLRLGIEAFKQSVEEDPVAQFVSLLA